MNTITLPKLKALKYLGVILGIIFMIMSIRVYINNYLTVEHSIKETQNTIILTQDQTDYIHNFQLPYLQTELAQRNLMHRQKIPQKGGKLVTISYTTHIQEAEGSTENEIKHNELEHKGRGNFIIYQRRRSTQK